MLRGASCAGADGLEVDGREVDGIELPIGLLPRSARGAQERVARRLSKSAPAPNPASSSTAMIMPSGDEPEV